jgi:hypothetical protein
MKIKASKLLRRLGVSTDATDLRALRIDSCAWLSARGHRLARERLKQAEEARALAVAADLASVAHVLAAGRAARSRRTKEGTP